uniref:Uncharacterized protein n=1 Tax=Sphaerodactylus townsendi TaxID=933632 RepID=A0ACB8GEL3_9SAUR
MGEPDEGKGLVPDKDEEPCDPDSGDEEKDALIPDRHDPSSGAACSTSNGDSVGLPYAWAPAQQAGRGPRRLSGRRQSEIVRIRRCCRLRLRRENGWWPHSPTTSRPGSRGHWVRLGCNNHRSRAPELRSFPHFMLALQRQFEDLFEEEKARVGLRQIRQGSRSMSEYVSEFRQLAGVVQDWPEQVKIHFFREGLYPEVAQWAMVTAEPTSLARWYMRAGKAEIRLRRVQLLKQ